MLSFLSVLTSLFTTIFSFFGKLMDYAKEQKLKETGRKELQGEISAREAEIIRKQAEILIRDDDIEKTIEDLKKGNF